MLCDCPFNKEGCNPYTQTHVVYSHPEDCLKYFQILVNMIGWVPSINTPCKLLQTTWLEECLPKLWYDIDILREIKIKTVFLMYTSLVLSIAHIKICPPKTCVLSYMLMHILMQTTAPFSSNIGHSPTSSTMFQHMPQIKRCAEAVCLLSFASPTMVLKWYWFFFNYSSGHQILDKWSDRVSCPSFGCFCSLSKYQVNDRGEKVSSIIICLLTSFFLKL